MLEKDEKGDSWEMIVTRQSMLRRKHVKMYLGSSLVTFIKKALSPVDL